MDANRAATIQREENKRLAQSEAVSATVLEIENIRNIMKANVGDKTLMPVLANLRTKLARQEGALAATTAYLAAITPRQDPDQLELPKPAAPAEPPAPPAGKTATPKK